MTLEISNAATPIKIMPATELEEIIQNVRTIISTLKGSVPMDRAFGVNGALLDEPISATQAKMTAEIAASIKKFEPRARLAGVSYGGELSDGELKMTLQIEIVERNLRGGLS